MENISSMSKVLTAKKEALPDLEERFTEATARFDEASKAREQKQRADDLKKELAWAHVATKEEVCMFSTFYDESSGVLIVSAF